MSEDSKVVGNVGSGNEKRALLSDTVRRQVLVFVVDHDQTPAEVSRLLELERRIVYGVTKISDRENRCEKKPKSGRKPTFEERHKPSTM